MKNVYDMDVVDILRIAYANDFRVLLVMNFSSVTERIKEICDRNKIEIEIVPECGCRGGEDCRCSEEELERYVDELYEKVMNADIVIGRFFRGKIDMSEGIPVFEKKVDLLWRLMSPEATMMLSDFVSFHQRLVRKYWRLQEVASVIAMLDEDIEEPVIDIEHMLLACMLAGVEFVYTEKEKAEIKGMI